MAFVDNAFRGALLVLLNGDDPKGAPRIECGNCGKPLLRVFITAGARRVDPSLPEWKDCCINASWKKFAGMNVPCPRALESKALIDQLFEAARA